ncbi:hypothetical protein JQ596_09125 [Bradyrhizobium manausense]|uniref:hypothetical protein n=1 Tax=Bradyrhizobium TaxID=374 RepID=UPI001BA6F6C0|nr:MULTISPECIES: hypothetical protein [Bradyrhizobium]MBR0825699.1 hypothetical protein [Bradyrhizobium manausense]UVO31353.1 hypothetical protein KUF59_12220 [Bradyrhizobium arachidis]
MSSLFLTLAPESPWPGIAVVSLNLIVAVSLVGVSLLLAVTVSVLACAHSLVDRELALLRQAVERRGFA